VADFQVGARLLQPVVVADWHHVPKRRRVNFVDRDVQVPVVGVLMHRRHALVRLEADRSAQPVLDVLHLRPARLFAFRKADHQVVVLA